MLKHHCLMIIAGLLITLLLPGPSAGDETDGKSIYASKCARCHGVDGTPKKFAKQSHAFNDDTWQKETPISELEQVISEGRGRMPSYQKRLTPEQIKLVAAYLKTL